MKKLVTTYTFDASAQTIDAADFTSLEKIQLITNVTDQVIIYNFADQNRGGTLSGTTLTLEYDTTSMADADKLQIFVEDGASVQPVSASSLPLPTGAATSAKQDTIIGHVDGIEGLLTTIDGDTGNISTKIDTLAGAVAGSEVQVDVVTMPTTTVQATDLDIRNLTGTDVVTVTGGAGQTADVKVTLDSESVAVTGTFWQATQPVSASSLPLPTGAATATKQDSIITELQNIDGGKLEEATFTGRIGEVQASPTANTVLDRLKTVGTHAATLAGAVTSNKVQVDVVTAPTTTVTGTVAVTGVATSAKQDTIIGHVDGIEGLLTTIDGDTGNISTKIDTLAGAVAGSEMQVDVVTSALPTGASSAANQTNGSQKTQIVDGSGNVIGATSNALDVNIKSGSSSGTQYTEADVDTTITGTAVMWEDTSDTLRAVSAAKPLPVNVVAGSTSGTEYTEGDTDASITGSAILWEDTSDTLRPVSASKPLPVDVVNSVTVDNSGTFAVQAAQSGTWNVTNISGTVSLPTGASTLAEQQTQTTALQLLDDTVATVASAITTKGVAAAGTDGTNARILKTDTSGELQIDVLTLPSIPAGANVIGALTANQSVNVAQINGVTTLMGNGNSGTGAQRVTIAADSTGQCAAIGKTAADSAVSAAPVTTGGRASTATPSAVSADGDVVNAWYTRVGAAVIAGTHVDDAAFTVATDRVVPAGFIADETATDSVDEGDVGLARMTLDRKQIVSTYAHTAGGYTPAQLISAASTNATSVKASAGTIGYIMASNTNASPRYLKIYNKASAPTVGTDTPVHTFLIPGNSTNGAGFVISLPPQGIALGTGIAFALTTGVAVADTAAVAANEIVVNYGWI